MDIAHGGVDQLVFESWLAYPGRDVGMREHGYHAPGFYLVGREGKLAVADGGDGRAVAMQEPGAAMACKQRHKLDVRDCVVDPSAERTIDMECSGPVKPPDFQCGEHIRVVLLGWQRDGMVS